MGLKATFYQYHPEFVPIFGATIQSVVLKGTKEETKDALDWAAENGIAKCHADFRFEGTKMVHYAHIYPANDREAVLCKLRWG